MNKKISISKIILLVFSFVFIILFFFMLAISVLVTVFSDFDTSSQGLFNNIICFIKNLSRFDSIKDPFSIFIQILTSVGGVFFGIRIDQWIDDEKEKEKISELWKKTNGLLKRLKSGINSDNINICELAEYKIYWDSLQRADNIATILLQEDERYIDIAYAFSFLAFYNSSWSKHKSINIWKANTNEFEVNRIQDWINSFDELISYTEKNAIFNGKNKASTKSPAPQ